MSRDADDHVQLEESGFSVFCFEPNDSETASRAYRVKISPGVAKRYKGVVLDISPDLPVQRQFTQVFDCDDESLVRLEIKVLKEIRDRHPKLLVQRYPAKRGSSNADGPLDYPQDQPSPGVAGTAGIAPPIPFSDGSANLRKPQMSLTQAYRTVMLIANDESDQRPTRESVRELATLLATVITILAEMEEGGIHLG